MTRIVFINPPIRTRTPASHIPYGIAQLASVSDATGAQTAVLDVNATRVALDIIKDELKSEIKEWGPWDIIAMGGLVTTYQWQMGACMALKREFPESLLIAGGGCASSLQEDMLKWLPELDLIVLGEGERTLEELLALAVSKEHMDPIALSDVKGLIYRNDLDKWAKLPSKSLRKRKQAVEKRLKNRRKVKLRNTGFRPLMTEDELNKLPYPAWHLFPLESSVEYGKLISGYFAHSSLPLSMEALQAKRRLDIIGSRGCPFHCRFCYHLHLGGDDLPDGTRLMPLVRYQSPEYMVEMIKWMLIHYKLDFISIQDESFTANKKRVNRFLDLLEDEDLIGTFKWGALGRAEYPSPELLRRMKESGLTYLSMGYESSHQPDLDYLEKEVTIEHQRRMLKALIEAEINPVTTYIVGFPDQTMQGLYDTARFWVKNGIQCTPFWLTPYPYTRVYWENEDKILAQYDGNKEAFVLALGDATNFVVNLTERFTDAELLGLRDLMVAHDLERLRKHSEWRVKMGLDPPEELIVDPDPPQPKLRKALAARETPEGGVKVD